MSKIDFKVLVEQLLNESIGNDMMALLSMPGNLTLEGCAKWASQLDKSGTSYLNKDQLMGVRPAFPVIDTLFGLFRVLQNNKVISGINEQNAEKYASILKAVDNIEDFFEQIETKPSREEEEKKYIIESLKNIVNNLFENKNDYRDYNSIRLKQLINQTQTLAAEEYLNMSPYGAILKLLKEYGGYDIKLIKNILYYPGETKYTQKSNIEGPIMGTIVEISKLMLLFYREYIIEQKEKTGKLVVNSVIKALGIKNFDDFKKTLDFSAGKLKPHGRAGQKIQQDYIKFLNGKSVFTIDPNIPPPVEMPMEPPKPAIQTINDFRNISGLSQEVYESFLSLFNNIKRGTHPNKWTVAGKTIYGGLMTGLESATQLAKGLFGISGHSLYGNR